VSFGAGLAAKKKTSPEDHMDAFVSYYSARMNLYIRSERYDVISVYSFCQYFFHEAQNASVFLLYFFRMVLDNFRLDEIDDVLGDIGGMVANPSRNLAIRSSWTALGAEEASFTI
jgi:hypothetical protein